MEEDMAQSNTKKVPKNRHRLIRTQLHTIKLKEELEQDMETVHRLQRQRNAVIEQVEYELAVHKDLKEKILFLKSEMKQLTAGINKNQRIVNDLKQSHMVLQVDLDMIEEFKRNNLQEKMEINNFQNLQSHLKTSKISENVKSIYFHFAKTIVAATSENEFDDFNWQAIVKVNESDSQFQFRLDHLTMTKKDLELVYRPLLFKLKTQFRSYRTSINARTKTNNGLITALELTLTVPSIVIERKDHAQL